MSNAWTRSGSADGKMPVINASLQCRVGVCITLALGHGLWEAHADLASRRGRRGIALLLNSCLYSFPCTSTEA